MYSNLTVLIQKFISILLQKVIVEAHTWYSSKKIVSIYLSPHMRDYSVISPTLVINTLFIGYVGYYASVLCHE